LAGPEVAAFADGVHQRKAPKPRAKRTAEAPADAPKRRAKKVATAATKPRTERASGKTK
jgi:hypothetical protein